MLRKLSKNVKIYLSILFIFLGIFFLSFTYFDSIKKNLFNHKNLELMEMQVQIEDIPEEIMPEWVPIEPDLEEEKKEEELVYKEPTQGYIGYLSVPEIGLKRGFTSLNDSYNNVNSNITLIGGSTLPDVDKGNTIFAAHSGTSSISYFKHLYKLNIGANASVEYNGKTYNYVLKYIYLEPKDGSLTIRRNGDVTTLTLITCTKNDNTKQTIYIFELVN